MPDPTVFFEHVGYNTAGDPLVRRLYSAQCLLGIPEFLHFEQVGYNAAGDPLSAWAWECCDAFCTDEEEANDDCRVRTDCVPTGIPRRLMAYLHDIETCFTARNKKTVLEYQDADPMDPLYQTWYGEVEMRGGTMEIVFSCAAGGVFGLSIGGCQAASPTAITVTCDDPLNVLFAQILADDCCDCQVEGTANPTGSLTDTDVPAEINITVVGDCRKTVFFEHVGYNAVGAPVVARAVPCAWADREFTEACDDMRCGLYYSIAGDGDCDCMDVVEDYLPYRDSAGGVWVNDSGGWGCPGGVRQIEAGCAASPTPGLLRITVNITCGVTAGGSGFIDIDPEDLEDLDVLVSVGLDNSTDPSECCAGSAEVHLWRP